VPLTAATITYDVGDQPTTEDHEVILFNRARATWIEVDAERSLDPGVEEESGSAAERRRESRATYLKDFTGPSRI
jgi:hypothetical protein